ncbi:hypothetical protein LINPERPRIM_LOCUS30447, partial [Linum perenne]
MNLLLLFKLPQCQHVFLHPTRVTSQGKNPRALQEACKAKESSPTMLEAKVCDQIQTQPPTNSQA